MYSIAIWYEAKGSKTPMLDLHINHWKLKLNKGLIVRKLHSLLTNTIGKIFPNFHYDNSDYFIDLGIKISDGTDVENVCLYLPGTFKENQNLIEDLGEKLKDKRLLTAVFNESYNTRTTDAKYYTVLGSSGEPIFNVYTIDTTNDIKIENKYQGTIIKFLFKSFDELPTYYRIRIKSPFVSKLSYTYTPRSSFLESIFSSVEVIDFRINDTRNIDISLIEHINSKCKFKLALVHYFVMRNVKDDYILSNHALNSVRQLEEKTWTSYISGSQHTYEKSFAYHLKKKAQIYEGSTQFIDDFSAVLKFRFENRKLVKYLIWLLLFSLLTGLLVNGLYDILKHYIKLFTLISLIICKLNFSIKILFS